MATLVPSTLDGGIAPAEHAIATLERARTRTLLLLGPLTEADAQRQHDSLMSPIVWDVGHIAEFEALWLLHNISGPIEFSEMPGLYNPFEHPRATRGALPLPTLAQQRERLASIRAQVRERLALLSFDGDDPLLRDGYVIRMVAQHESQHQETILQTLQLKQGDPYPAPRVWAPPSDPPAVAEGMTRVDPSGASIGTDDRSEAYDNERPRVRVNVPPFWIDRAPVSNAEFREFVERGGYDDRRLWTDEGWRWRIESGSTAPKYWERRHDGWTTRTMDRTEPLDPRRPVCHVCCHEAEAYARSVGKRLPSEYEWEIAATWDPATGRAQRFPWGDEPATPELANVDQLAFGTAPIGSYRRNMSPVGCYGMIGDVWEWTSSPFHGYPGFAAFPYPEYSASFFGGDYRVLRGGSWATSADVARATFRNWDYPIRRQIFAGFRCARDA